jgi:hypothetical protein
MAAGSGGMMDLSRSSINSNKKNPEEMTIDDEEVNTQTLAKDLTFPSGANIVKSLPSSRFNGALMREEVANNGESYCFQCGRHFIDDLTLKAHQKSKLHKKKFVLLSTKFIHPFP